MKQLNPLPQSPARALLVIDQPVLSGVVELALNHATYRPVTSAPACK